MIFSSGKLTFVIYVYVYTFLLDGHIGHSLKCYKCITYPDDRNIDCEKNNEKYVVECKEAEKFCSVVFWVEEGESGITVEKLCSEEYFDEVIPGLGVGKSCTSDKCNNKMFHVQEESSGSVGYGGSTKVTLCFVMFFAQIAFGVIAPWLLI